MICCAEKFARCFRADMTEREGVEEMSNYPKRDLLDIAHEATELGALDAARGVLQLHDTLDDANLEGLGKAFGRTARRHVYNLYDSPSTKLYRERLERGWTIKEAFKRLGGHSEKVKLFADTLRAYETDAGRAAKAPMTHIQLLEKLYGKRWEELGCSR